MAIIDQATFKATIWPFLRKVEGGFTANARDPGNWTSGRVGVGKLVGTKYGIAANTYPKLAIRDLTEDAAIAIYYRDFFKGRWDALPLPLAFVATDAGVNCGVKRPLPWVDRVRSEPVDRAVRDFCALNLAFHKSLRTWSTFGRGWERRISDEQSYALRLISPVHSLLETDGLANVTVRSVPHAKTQPRGIVRTISQFFAPLEYVPAG